MTTKFKVGDHVRWNSQAGHVTRLPTHAQIDHACPDAGPQGPVIAGHVIGFNEPAVHDDFSAIARHTVEAVVGAVCRRHQSTHVGAVATDIRSCGLATQMVC